MDMNLLTILPNLGRGFCGFYFAGAGLMNIYHWRGALNVLIQKKTCLCP